MTARGVDDGTPASRPPYAVAVQEYLTLDEAAAELALTSAEVYRLVRAGDLYGIKAQGRGWLVTRGNLDAYRAGAPQTAPVP